MGQMYYDSDAGCTVELKPVCPRCRANVYWTLVSGREGATGIATCANHASATRIIVDISEMHICEWEGIVMRCEDGSVIIYDKSMRKVPYRVERK